MREERVDKRKGKEKNEICEREEDGNMETWFLDNHSHFPIRYHFSELFFM